MEIFKHYKFTLITIILILIGILMPGRDVPSVGIPHLDKLVHLGMFASLALCYYGEYIWYNKKLPQVFVPWIIMEIYALLTEIMQQFVEGRSCDVFDFIVDSIGILLVILLFRIIYKKRLKKQVNRMRS